MNIKPRYRWNGSRWLPACPRAASIGVLEVTTYRRQVIIRAPGNGGYKTAAARVAEALGGRWTHRWKGYVMSSEARARAAARLHAAGWDGGIMARELSPPVGRPWSPSDLPRGARLAA